MIQRYPAFTLYWEAWGGYADRDEPFGLPRLVWVVASAGRAARCVVAQRPVSASEVTWSTAWRRIPRDLVEPLPVLLEQAGAFGHPLPLVDDGDDSPYVRVWQLTGVSGDRPFHLRLQFTTPDERWTPLGRRLADALHALGSAESPNGP